MRAQPLTWELSRLKKEWRLHPPGVDRRRRPLAVVGKRRPDGGWVALINATPGFHGTISAPFADVEDAVQWAEGVITTTKELSCLFQ